MTYTHGNPNDFYIVQLNKELREDKRRLVVALVAAVLVLPTLGFIGGRVSAEPSAQQQTPPKRWQEHNLYEDRGE